MTAAPRHETNQIPVAKLAIRVGQDLGTTQAHSYSAEEVAAYGRMVCDTHWMHIDAERCATESPFGKPVVHWHRLIAAVHELSDEVFEVTGVKNEVFYGIDKTRFPAPLLVGDRFTATVTLVGIEEISPGVHHGHLRMTFSKEGSERPVAVVEYSKLWNVD